MNKKQIAREVRDVISGSDCCTHITIGKIGRSWFATKDLNYISAPEGWENVQSFQHSCNHATIKSVLENLIDDE